MAGIFVPQAQQKRDTLGEVLQGLQVAATGFGIYKDVKGLEAQKEQLDIQRQMKDAEIKKTEAETGKVGAETASIGEKAKAEAAKSGGFLDVPTYSKYQQEGWRIGDNTNPNAVKFTTATPAGNQEIYLDPPMSTAEKYNADQLAEGKKKAIDKTLADAKDVKTQENILRKEYFDDDTTKSTRTVVEGYDKISSLIDSKRSGGANDVAIIYAWAKMQDPGGRVTDSDFSAGQNLSGPVAKVRNYFDYVMKGQQLRPEDKVKILAEAKDIYKSQLQNQNDVDNYYKGLSDHYGVNTAGVISKRYDERYQKLSKDSQTTGTVLNKPSWNPSVLPVEDTAQGAQPFDINTYLRSP